MKQLLLLLLQLINFFHAQFHIGFLLLRTHPPDQLLVQLVWKGELIASITDVLYLNALISDHDI